MNEKTIITRINKAVTFYTGESVRLDSAFLAHKRVFDNTINELNKQLVAKELERLVDLRDANYHFLNTLKSLAHVNKAEIN
jgi:hypothetical protein